jgi:hypothetical protein
MSDAAVPMVFLVLSIHDEYGHAVFHEAFSTRKKADDYVDASRPSEGLYVEDYALDSAQPPCRTFVGGPWKPAT